MKTNKLLRAMNVLQNSRYFHVRLLIEGSLIGCIVGFVISLFRLLLEKSDTWRETLYKHFSLETWPLIALYFAGLILIGIILDKITKTEPLTSGSGIPQIKGILLGKIHMNWLRVLTYKFIGGVLAIGSGLSLGREGPSVQLGATIAQGISRLRSLSRMEERFLLSCGAGAGLAAAFNSPLAGVIFCLEELQKNFSPMSLLPAIASALTATLVGQEFFGNEPVFNITGLKVIPLESYVILLFLGIFIGILARLFNKVILISLAIYEKHLNFNLIKKPIFPLMLAGILGFVLPQILGGGSQLVDLLFANNYPLLMLLLLFVSKFIFTMICFGSGVPGGIFLPMLVLGALAGSVFAHISISIGILDQLYLTNIIVLSMAGYFSAVVKAPVTGSILIMEMTNSFEQMLALISVSMIAYVVADLLKGKPIYDELLERALSKILLLRPVEKYKRLILELVIENGATADGVLIKKIEWPPSCLIINLKRGEIEISPNGDTRIQAGDYLYIFANDQEIAKLKELTSG